MEEDMTDEQKNILLGAVLGFTLSIISQLITSVTNYLNNKNKVRKFEKLIFNTYIKDIKVSLERSEDGNIEELKRDVSVSINKIDYLLKNELSYLNAAWQFEAIRICELAKAKLKQVSDQLDVYSFKDITAIEKDSDIKINKEKSLLIIAAYEKTVKKYSKLKAEKTI